MGSIVKGVGSLFGGRKRRREEQRTKANFEKAESKVENFDFKNPYANMQGGSYDVGTFESQNRTVDQLGDPRQSGLATLPSAEDYSAQGYTSEGYTAGQTSIGGLARGANTGLTNTMNNLQVSTAAAEMQAQEADQSLAASQDLAAQAGTGAGGATALAAAAARSKQGVASSIDQQVKQNEMLRARGESELQRSQLAQGNMASKFDLGQSQFNVSATNQAAQFGASAANQAAQFGANAENQAGRFRAQSKNQFALSEFGAANAMEMSNVGASNRFSQQQFGANNQFELANMAAQERGDSFNIGNQIGADRFRVQSEIRAAEQIAGGEAAVQGLKYGRAQDTMGRRAGEYQAAKDARAQAKADLIGGIAGIADVAAMGIGGGTGSFGGNFAQSLKG